MAIAGEIIKRYLDLSGGEKHWVNRFKYVANQLRKARNIDLNREIGSATRRYGYEQVGVAPSTPTPVTGLISFQHTGGYDLYRAVTNADGATHLGYLNYGYNWTDVITDFPAGARVESIVYPEMEKAFVVAYSPQSNQFGATTVINSDRTTTRGLDVVNAPQGKTIAKYGNHIAIGNIQIKGKRYPNRVAISSLPTDIITLINGDQTGYLWQLNVANAKYLSPGMLIDIYAGGTDQKKVDGLAIVTVDVQNNVVTFAGQPLSVDNNDCVYLHGQKGNLRLFWYDKDFLFVPPKENEIPEVTWVEEANNRLIVWTHSSLWKWDGANLINISPTIGCPCPHTIKKIANNWILWSDGLNIWAYNELYGAPQKISRGMEVYLRQSQQPKENWFAMAQDDIYTLYVGACNDLTARLTSTSTSSTSTSSTSTSTSSTSTSSTSTSSITTSTSTSTSSSSSSTSSTSTSSTSTSSTTTLSTKITYRLRYSFNLNAYTVDTLDRDVTAATLHEEHGLKKMYWGDETGRVYRAEVGQTDNGRAIPVEIETIRYDDGAPELLKDYREIYVYLDKGEGASLYLSFDGGQWIPIVQLDDGSQRIKPRDAALRGQLLTGHDYAIKITQNDPGEGVVFQGTVSIYTPRREQ